MASRELENEERESTLPGRLRTDSLAWFVVAVGFGLRVAVAASTFLDPDEAFHFVLGHQASLRLAYQASFSSAHPPLLIVLIYCLRGLGSAEFMLRLPSVMAGTLSCWLAYKWLAAICDGEIAMAGLVLLSFSPPLFALESELRQYSLLLLFSAAALVLFEKAVQKRSWLHMTLFSLALCLALVSHYGALLFAVSMGVYALLRFTELRPRPRLAATWGAGQAVFLGLATFFYKTHVPTVEQGIRDSWLHKSFYHPGDHVIPFLGTNLYRFFHFLFGQPVVGAIMLLLFVAGVAALLMRPADLPLKFGKAGAVVVFAVALNMALSLAGLYPFGGTRHSVFLLPFVALGIGAGLAGLLKERSHLAPLLAAGAVCVCSVFPAPSGPHMQPPNQNIVLMRRAAEYVHAAAPSGLVLVDQQTVFPFRYYFCRQEYFPFAANPENFACGSYQAHKSGALWDLSGERLAGDLKETRAAFSQAATAKVVVFQTGWSVGDMKVLNTLKHEGCARPMFGKNILACDVE